MKNITLPQIETFLTVARYLNCSRAASHLHVTQPSLSKTLKTFETSVGRKLLIRNSHGISLTETGEYLYHALDNIYNDLEKVLDYASAINPDESRKLRVVVPILFDSDETFEPVRRLFDEFSEKHRNISVETTLCDFTDQRQAIGLGMADIAITMDFVLYGMDDIAIRRIRKMNRYIAVSATHPIAKKEELDFSELENEVFFRVMNNGDDYMREILINECQQYGFQPKRVEFLPNLMTFIHNVKERKGLGICGQFRNYGDEYGIKYYPLPEIKDCQYIVVAWRADYLTKDMKAFLDMI